MRCYLDMDGVLVDLVAGILVDHGVRDPYYPATEKNRGNYDTHELLGMTHREFINPMYREDFWVELEATLEKDDLLRMCEAAFGRDNVYIVSQPCGFARCLSGKWTWVRHNLEERYLDRLILTANKANIAAPDAYLIDDCDANLERWTIQGAPGCVFPRPWNHHWNHADDPLAYLRVQLDILLNFNGDYDDAR